MSYPRCGKRAQSDKYVPSGHSFVINCSLFSDKLRFIKPDKQKLWQELQMGSLRKSASSSQEIAFNKQTFRQHRNGRFNPEGIL